MVMNKKIPVVLLMGFMLVFPAIAFAQPQVPDIFTAGSPALLAMDVEGATEPQWVPGEKEFVEEDVARASEAILSSDYLTAQYKSFEVTPFVGSGLYGITLSFKW